MIESGSQPQTRDARKSEVSCLSCEATVMRKMCLTEQGLDESPCEGLEIQINPNKRSESTYEKLKHLPTVSTFLSPRSSTGGCCANCAGHPRIQASDSYIRTSLEG